MNKSKKDLFRYLLCFDPFILKGLEFFSILLILQYTKLVIISNFSLSLSVFFTKELFSTTKINTLCV